MRDVASRAGVSTATVSAVLGKTCYVSEDLTRRVLEAAGALGYRPNHIARSLRRQATETVGVLIPTILHSFLPTVLKEIDTSLSANGYGLLFGNTRESEESEAALISLMRDKRVDGLLIACITPANLSLLEEMVQDGCAVVTFQTSVAAGRLDCVAFDDFRGSYNAVRHLIETGHRRIAALSPGWYKPLDDAEQGGSRLQTFPHVLPRLRGYEAALREAGLDPEPSLYLAGGVVEQHTTSTAREAILEALRCPHPPDAVFVTNTSRVLGVLDGAKAAGARIPDDLAIIGYDEHPWAQYLDPPLSVVARDGAKMGRIATELLLRRMRQPASTPPETVTLPTELIVRASSLPALARVGGQRRV